MTLFVVDIVEPLGGGTAPKRWLPDGRRGRMDPSEADTRSEAQKVFSFEGNDTSLCVSIPEVLDPHFGMYVWPCAVVLAQYLWTRRDELKDKSVLELGAGVSLPGVVAAKCGAKVILSDAANTPLCLENCRRSCRANGLEDVLVLGLTWGEVSPDLLVLPKLDFILGSDVFYEPADFEDVLVTVAFLLRKNPSAQFWTTYQERSGDWSIEALLHRWKLECVDVQLESFNANKCNLAGSDLPGRHGVQMMIITLPTKERLTNPISITGKKSSNSERQKRKEVTNR